MGIIRLEVKVITKSSKEELVEEDGKLKAYVRVAPTKGKANKAVIDLVAEKYNIPKSHVRIILGLTNRNKVVEVMK